MAWKSMYNSYKLCSFVFRSLGKVEQLSWCIRFRWGHWGTGCLHDLLWGVQLVAEFCIKYSVCILSSHNDDALNLSRTFVFIILLDQPNNPIGGRMGEKLKTRERLRRNWNSHFLSAWYGLYACCVRKSSLLNIGITYLFPWWGGWIMGE